MPLMNGLLSCPQSPPYFDTDLEDLLTQMLQADPKKRITIAGIKQHAWYKGKVHAPQNTHTSTQGV